jgi:hypothetical protein
MDSGQVVEVKQYKMAADRMLREHMGMTVARHRGSVLSFSSASGSVGHTINPYLVILAAEINLDGMQSLVLCARRVRSRF